MFFLYIYDTIKAKGGNNMKSEKGKVVILEKYIDRENSVVEYSEEMNFYMLVKLGKKEEVSRILKNNVFNENTKKALSDDPIQSLKYHLVVTAGVLARYCIEGGMEHARAYEISDYYIRKADKALTGKEVADLNSKMCMDYTVQMEKQHKQFVYSKQVVKSIDYIYSHLHCRITIPEIASYVKLNENYFSKLFSKEVGIPVSRYIMKRKIEAAENLLRYSEYSCSEISELLSFSSQSHFISRFRSECAMTPSDYRKAFHNHTGFNR